MPQGVPIQAIPAQQFQITLDNNVFDITLKEADGIMAMSVQINGVDTIDNLICAAAAPIIPARYLETGNFMFLTANAQLPYYEQFGVTQSLVYFTASELAAFRVPAATTSPGIPTVNANSFNAAGELPLRFSPQGYMAAP